MTHPDTSALAEAVRLLQLVVSQLPAPQARRINAAVAGMELLTPKDCARLAGCARRTVDRAIHTGALRAAHGITGLVTVNRSDFDAWDRARRPDSAEMANLVQRRRTMSNHTRRALCHTSRRRRKI